MDFSENEFNEILNIFLAESEEIIARLNNNLLALEKNPKDKDVILLLFRDAHSLKGAARMIGFTTIQNIAHKVEDILGLAKDEKTRLNSKMADALYKTVDFLADMIKKSVEQKHEVVTEDAKKQLEILADIATLTDEKSKKQTVSKKNFIDIKLLSENMSDINKTISNGLFVLMQLEISCTEQLIAQLLTDVENLFKIFNNIGIFEIKQELSNIKTKLNITKSGSNVLSTEETEEISQRFNIIIENLIYTCEANDIEIFDFYSQALSEMAQLSQEETPQPKKAEPEVVAAEVISEEPTIVIEEKKNVNLSTLQDDFSEIDFENPDFTTIISDLKSYQNSCPNTSVNNMLKSIENILAFSDSKKIELTQDVTDAITQGFSYCNDILTGNAAEIDEHLVIQQLEISKQLMEIKQAGEIVQTEEEKSNEGEKKSSAIDFSRILDSSEIKTLRVDSHKLDMLVNQVGELIVAKMKTKSHVSEITEINSKLEDWERNLAKVSNYLKYYEKKFINESSGSKNPTVMLIKQLLSLHEQDSEQINGTIKNVTTLKKQLLEDNSKMDNIVQELDEMVKNVRVLPIATIFHMFGRMVRDIAKEKNKKVELEISGSETCTDKKIIEEIKTPLIHIIRNAIDHGIETPEERMAAGKSPVGKIIMRAKAVDDKIILEIEDDGRGINLKKIKETALNKGFLTREEADSMDDEQIMNIIFVPGFSTGETITDISGRGIGLDVVQTKINRLNGKIKVLSEIGKGCCLKIELPTSMSTSKFFLVKIGEQTFGIPLASINGISWKKSEEILSDKASRSFKYRDKIITLYKLSDILKMPKTEPETASDKTTIVIIGDDDESRLYGLEMDKLIGEQEMLIKKLTPPLYRVKNIAGVTTLETGEICLILNMTDLLKTITQKEFITALETKQIQPAIPDKAKDYNLLLVDDSVTTISLERKMLERAGYNVEIASNPIEAFDVLDKTHIDIIISDVEMPEMDGFEFLQKLKTDEMYADIPFVFVSSIVKEENFRKAEELGAVKYITKYNFSRKLLLDTVTAAIAERQN